MRLNRDPRVLYLQARGGMNTIAQALKSIEDEYSGTCEWPPIGAKVNRKAVILTSGFQDDSTWGFNCNFGARATSADCGRVDTTSRALGSRRTSRSARSVRCTSPLWTIKRCPETRSTASVFLAYVPLLDTDIGNSRDPNPAAGADERCNEHIAQPVDHDSVRVRPIRQPRREPHHEALGSRSLERLCQPDPMGTYRGSAQRESWTVGADPR